jgi:hypothetical protein
LIFTGITGYAQPLLPDLAATSQQGKVSLTWTSAYHNIRQIGVQRSRDSLYNYATIGYVRNPGLKTNSFTDSRPMAGTQYYKLILVSNDGSFFFSHPVKVVPGAVTVSAAQPAATVVNNNVFRPSVYVYTNADGDVNVSLADAGSKHYSIWFYDSSGTRIFTVDNITQPFLVLDKSNFLHSGWFSYELFEAEKPKEKWKFFIPPQPPPKGSRPATRSRRR